MPDLTGFARDTTNRRKLRVTDDKNVLEWKVNGKYVLGISS